MSSGVSTQAGVEIAQLAGEAGFITGTAFTMVGITLVVSAFELLHALPVHPILTKVKMSGSSPSIAGTGPRLRAPQGGGACGGGQAVNFSPSILMMTFR